MKKGMFIGNNLMGKDKVVDIDQMQPIRIDRDYFDYDKKDDKMKNNLQNDDWEARVVRQFFLFL